MSLTQIELTTIDGHKTTFGEYSDKVVMVVNVASRCGFTPQYTALEQVQRRYGAQGFTVLGFPCNQFMMQEPGSAQDIKEFCATFDVTFPLFEKIQVNGHLQHPLYRELTQIPDAAGHAGRVKWNFEKFLITPAGAIQRFRSATVPDAPEVVSVIEAALQPAVRP
jgi:glutathione peroxidase